MAARSIGDLYVRLSARTSAFSEGMTSAVKKVEGFQRTVEHAQDAAAKWDTLAGIGRTIAVGFGAAAAGLLGLSAVAVKAASDLNETSSAMGVAFGAEGAQRVEAWVEQTAQALGRGEAELREGVTRLNMLLKPMVGNEAAALKLSKAFTTLAVDAGSLFNVMDADALQAFQAGLRGESDPMERFGVSMTEASLKAYLLEKGLRINIEALEEKQKVTLRAAYMLERLAHVQGDAAATADSFANQSKKLQGNVKDVAAEMGQALLPAATKLVTALNGAVAWFRSLSDDTRKWIAYGTAAAGVFSGVVAGVAALGAALLPAISSLVAMGVTWGSVGAAATTAWTAVLAPVAAVAAAIGGIILLAGALGQAWDANLFGIQEAWAATTDFFGARLKDMAEGFNVMLEVGLVVFNGWKDGLFDFVESALRGIAAVGDGLSRLGIGSGGMGEWARGALGTVGSAREATTMSRGRAGELADSLGTTLAGWGKVAGKEIGGALSAAGDGIASSFTRGMAMVQGALGVGGPGAAASDLSGARAAQRAQALALSDEMLGNVKAGQRAQFTVGKVGGSGGFSKELDAMARQGTSPALRAYHKAMEEKAAALAAATAKAMDDARHALADRFSQAMGSISRLAETFTQGLAASGGNPLAAVGAVVGELLLRSEGFAQVMATVEGVVATVADLLGMALAPFNGLIGALGLLVTAILPALQPVFDMLASVIEPLIPPIVAVATIIGALVPVFTVVFNVFKQMYLPFRLIEPAMRLLFEVVRGVGLVVLDIAKALGDTWNWVLDAVKGFLDSIGLGALGSELDGIRMDTDALSKSMTELDRLTWDAAAAKGEEAAAAYRTRDAMKELNDELLNAPAAWKVARARFDAQDPQDGPTGGGSAPSSGTPNPGPSAPSSPAQPAPSASGGTTINIYAHDTDTALSAAERKREEWEFRETLRRDLGYV